jgi:hypothetical protein
MGISRLSNGLESLAARSLVLKLLAAWARRTDVLSSGELDSITTLCCTIFRPSEIGGNAPSLELAAFEITDAEPMLAKSASGDFVIDDW